MPGPKYVKDFSFDPKSGYTGSAGVQHVQPYKRGGAAKAKMPALKPVTSKPDFKARAEMPGGMAEGGHWIQDAIKKPGALKKSLDVKDGEKIPAKKLEAATKKPGKMGQRARFAETLRHMNKAEGGKVDMAEDQKVSAKAVHEHERHLHKGQPLTKLKRGGAVPVHKFSPLVGK